MLSHSVSAWPSIYIRSARKNAAWAGVQGERHRKLAQRNVFVACTRSVGNIGMALCASVLTSKYSRMSITCSNEKEKIRVSENRESVNVYKGFHKRQMYTAHSTLCSYPLLNCRRLYTAAGLGGNGSLLTRLLHDGIELQCQG